MKKTLLTGLALGAALISVNAFALTDNNTGSEVETINRHGNYGGAGIVGSSHDLGTGLGYNVLGPGAQSTNGRICIYCHHPHHAMTAAETGVGYSPLWNRTVPATAFTPYDNGMMMNDDAGYAEASAPGNSSSARNWMNGTPLIGGVSMLCMSCHDGNTAMNAYSGLRNGAALDIPGSNSFQDTAGITTAIAGGANLAGGNGAGGGEVDMSNHHPIGMVWADVVAADAEIATSDTEFLDASGVSIGVNIAGLLYDGKMECVTCHDVHNTQNEVGAERFLWVSNNNSAFCLTCHLK